MDNPSLESPIDFATATQELEGSAKFVAAKLEQVFREQIAAGLHPGAQLVVVRQGRVVFDSAAGMANLKRKQPVTHETPFHIFSCTKSFTAVCVHHLEEMGKLELDAPVQEYWPEFGNKGKGGITVRHALTHQAGLPTQGMPIQVLLWPWPQLVARYLARLTPAWPPGSRMEYHVVNGSFILGELIFRASGLRPSAYLQRHFLQPLGMQHTFTGLPFRYQAGAAYIYNRDPEQRAAASLFNLPIYRSLYIPAASINTTARDLAVFYQMLCNGGTYAGRHYLKSETIRRATTLAYDGPDGDTGKHVRWAPGFNLGGYSVFLDQDIRMMGKGSTLETFGHPGQGGVALAWADPPSGTVFAFTNNHFQEVVAAHRRFEALSNCVWN
ncbi:MAG: serine hydrolase domain-containing protein [Chloroflexota bacterium]